MINIWPYFHNLTAWMVPLALGVFTAGITFPLRSMLLVAGPSRLWPFHLFVFVNTLVEEVMFRLLILGFLASMFEYTLAVVIMSVMYSIYCRILYGVPAMADGLVIGAFLSFALPEFGFPVIVGAHIVYRLIFSLG